MSTKIRGFPDCRITAALQVWLAHWSAGCDWSRGFYNRRSWIPGGL